MIAIVCGNTHIGSIPMEFEMFDHMMKNQIIGENDFIAFVYPDGSRISVRKKSVDVYYEEGEED